MLKTLVNIIAGLVLAASVGIYATSLNTATRVYEGPRILTVAEPNDRAASVEWMVSDGRVTGAQVTWVPQDRTTTIRIKVGGSIGWTRVRIDVAGTGPRTDFLTIKPPVDTTLVSSAKLDISGR